ncbi:hypothetical protein [Elioraea tepidiphila]|uniref:hypothetical protein n=1 Tax=Elioraea tepidiphila TaxID=457934 RepID=UPI000368AE0D|nr:hypothetical protein [Elioraea tepidiphila]
MIRLVLLGLVLAGVWYLYRMVTQQGAASTPPPAQPANDAGPAEAAPPPEAEAEEMTECPVCRAYLPVGAHEGCGRPDCPIPAVAAAQEEGAGPPPEAPRAEEPPKPA